MENIYQNMDYFMDLNDDQKNLVYQVQDSGYDYNAKKVFKSKLVELCDDIMRDSVYCAEWLENDWEAAEPYYRNPARHLIIEGTVNFCASERQLFQKIQFNECVLYSDIKALQYIFTRWVDEMVRIFFLYFF